MNSMEASQSSSFIHSPRYLESIVAANYMNTSISNIEKLFTKDCRPASLIISLENLDKL